MKKSQFLDALHGAARKISQIDERAPGTVMAGAKDLMNEYGLPFEPAVVAAVVHLSGAIRIHRTIGPEQLLTELHYIEAAWEAVQDQS